MNETILKSVAHAFYEMKPGSDDDMTERLLQWHADMHAVRAALNSCGQFDNAKFIDICQNGPGLPLGAIV
jgi:hypothetical protein